MKDRRSWSDHLEDDVLTGIPVFQQGLTRPRSEPSSASGVGLDPRRVPIEVLRGEGIRLVSIDLFDTLVTRACGAPADLFLWLGRRLARNHRISVSPEVFARARSRAEDLVWAREGGMDSKVDLQEIQRELVRLLDLDDRFAAELVAEELQLERDVTRTIPGWSSIVGASRSDRAVPVVVTSDTYFTREQVLTLLHEREFDPDRVFISSETATSKASGHMFVQVTTQMRARPESVLHVGDNPHSDVDVPRSLGIRAAWLPEARLNRFEECMSRHSYPTAGLSASLAGASRAARLRISARSVHERSIRDVAAGVAAPVLIGYVLWVLRRAIQHSLGRVAFLARDGQVLAAIADRLVDHLELPIDVTYLAVSRQSTNLAATFGASPEETDWVFRDIGSLDGEGLVGRFGLALEDAIQLLRPHGQVEADAAVGELGRVVRCALTEDSDFRDAVLARAASKRPLVTEYLRQEGLVGNQPVGIVDFGGVGSQVRAVHDLTTFAGGVAPRIFLMGLDDPVQAGVTTPAVDPDWLGLTETWLYDHRRGLGMRRGRGFGTCVQMFCAADHGTVLGYERSGPEVRPVLAAECDEPVSAWGVGLLQETILAVADEMVLDDDLVDGWSDLRDLGTALVDLFWSEPTEDEARAWGRFPLEGAQAASSPGSGLAHPYSVSEVVRGLWDGSFPDLGWQHWYEGSRRISPSHVRWGLSVAERGFRMLTTARGPAATRVLNWARSRRP